MLRKKLLTVAAVAVSAMVGVTCAACGFGGRSGEDGIDMSELEYSGKLTVWWPGSSVEKQAILQAKEDYTKEHPDVQIELIEMATSDFYTSYTLACASNKGPDIAYVDHVYVQALAHSSYIANLSSAGFDDLKDTFVETLWSPGTYQEKLYALPMSANVLVTAYNKTLIARAQNTAADSITLPKNFEEYTALCAQISALNGSAGAAQTDPLYGLTLPSGTDNDSMASMSYLAYVNRSGGEGILSSDLTKSLFDSDASKSAAKKLAEIGKYAPQTFSESQFEKGNIGFIEIGPWKIADYERYTAQYGWEIGYTTAIPFTEGGNNGSTIGLFDLVVTNKQSNQKQMALAADFARFITTNDKYQLAFSTPQNLIPTTKTAIANEFYAGDVWQVFIEQLQNVVVRPGSPAWASIERLLGDFVTKLVQQKFKSDAEIEQNCEAYSELIQEALDEIYEDA